MPEDLLARLDRSLRADPTVSVSIGPRLMLRQTDDRPPVAVQVNCSTSSESFAAWSVREAVEKILRRVEG